MTRFYFEIKSAGVFDVIKAESLKDAQQKLMYSGYAPFYNQIQWLLPNVDPTETTP